jgi:hypothetical protein
LQSSTGVQACLGAARPARGLLLPASAGFESPVWHGVPRARRHRRLFEVAEVDLAHLHGQRRWRDIGGFGGGELEQPRGHGGAPSGLYRAAQWAGLSSCEYRAAQSRQARPEEAQEHLGAGADLLRCQGGTSTLSVLAYHDEVAVGRALLLEVSRHPQGLHHALEARLVRVRVRVRGQGPGCG